ncbi:ASCH domain-containing protein [Candidatus Daviesbacteria bacterium]|nr:ASCH domain-containing protein [Candidatus Daviesbacteria bacterium]
MKHLAIFKGDGAKKILSGKKTIESRFSKRRNPPFGQIATGDLVYIKPSGEDIIGQFRVKKVIFYDGLDLSDLSNLRKRYGRQLAAGEGYWQQKQDSRYGTLIFIGEVDPFITSPIKFPKKDLRGWVVLEGTSS